MRNKDGTFAKGVSGNPSGHPKDGPESSRIRRLSQEQVEEVASFVLEQNVDKLRELATNPDSSVLKVWFASAAMRGIKNGDISALAIILDRVVGKVPIRLEAEIQTKLELLKTVENYGIDILLEKLPEAVDLLQLEAKKPDGSL